MRPSKISLVCGGAWLLLVGIASAGWIVPVYAESARLEREIAELEAELAKPADGPEVIERLATQVTQLEALMHERMRPIPDDSDVAGLMLELSLVLDELGLVEREVTTGAPKQLDEARSMPMSVLLRGEFLSIYAAVRHIEALPRLVRVQHVRILTDRSRQALPNRTGVVEAELVIEVFFAPRDIAGLPPGEDA